MKAFGIDRYKGELTARDIRAPSPRSDEVVVAVAAASVNPLDIKLQAGEFRTILPYDLPLILGNDMAGTVVEVGHDVRQFKVGDEVFARVNAAGIGTFAERIAVAEADLALKPASLTSTQAAAIPLVALTAWQVLIERAELKAGQKILIHAGSGGVGTMAIQLAKHFGATVAATASGANLELLKALGADIAIDYREEDFAKRLGGYDVVLSSLSPDILQRSLGVLRPGGRLISISGPPDPAFANEINASLLIRILSHFLSFRIRHAARRRAVDYSFHFMHSSGEQLAQIAALVDAGTLKPVIDSVFSFEEAPAAMARVKTGRVRGKVVIEIEASGAREKAAA
jgi:alcohol dehydrogenase